MIDLTGYTDKEERAGNCRYCFFKGTSFDEKPCNKCVDGLEWKGEDWKRERKDDDAR